MPLENEKISEQIHSLIQICTRLDTNLSTMSHNFSLMETRIEDLVKNYTEIKTGLEVIKVELETGAYDSKIKSLEVKNEILKDKIHKIDLELLTVKNLADSSKSNWKTVLDICFKICVGVATGYILYMAGIGVHLL